MVLISAYTVSCLSLCFSILRKQQPASSTNNVAKRNSVLGRVGTGKLIRRHCNGDVRHGAEVGISGQLHSLRGGGPPARRGGAGRRHATGGGGSCCEGGTAAGAGYEAGWRAAGEHDAQRCSLRCAWVTDPQHCHLRRVGISAFHVFQSEVLLDILGQALSLVVVNPWYCVGRLL